MQIYLVYFHRMKLTHLDRLCFRATQWICCHVALYETTGQKGNITAHSSNLMTVNSKIRPSVASPSEDGTCVFAIDDIQEKTLA